MQWVQTYLPYLLIAGVFIFMMKNGGCCGGHGGHSGQNRQDGDNSNKKSCH